jgi:hypothetical protein
MKRWVCAVIGLLTILKMAVVDAVPLVMSCPNSISVDLEFKGPLKTGQTIFDGYFPHTPDWAVNFEPGKGYQAMPFKTAKGSQVQGMFAGVQDLQSVPLHKMTILGMKNAQNTTYSRVVCQYRTDPNGGFRITLGKDAPLTHTCFQRGNYASCVDKVTIECPSTLVGDTVPDGWMPGPRSNFVGDPQKSTPFCQSIALIATMEMNCKYCGANQSSFMFIKKSMPANMSCSAAPSSQTAICQYPGGQIEPL